MILVVCPNLSVDATLQIDGLERGTVRRVRRAIRRAGGKGVNVARALGELGEPALVLGLAGGDEIQRRFAEEPFDTEIVPIDGESRTCTIALEDDGVATVLNEEGPTVSDPEPLLERFRELLPRARAVACMGSLQPGLPRDLYARMVTLGRERGIPSLVDTSGSPLAATVAAGPDVLTPNELEAGALLDRTLGDEASCLEAARDLRALGPATVYVTRGADGAVAAGPEGWLASARLEAPVDLRFGNPVGAGDAFVAGALFARLRGFDPADTLRFAVATATASLAHGYGQIRPRDLRPDSIVVTAH